MTHGNPIRPSRPLPSRSAAIPPSPKRVSTGTCIILKGEQVVDQQNCRALAASEDTANGTAAAGFANGMTYVWPSGNRTVVGGTEDEFSVNGNGAIPLPDDGRGLCLMVEKTGKTFCYKDGAKTKAAAVKPAAPPTPPDPLKPSALQAAPLSPALDDRSRGNGNRAGRSCHARGRDQAAQDGRGRGQIPQGRSCEAQNTKATRGSSPSWPINASLRWPRTKKKAEAEKARIDAALKEIDDLKAKCTARDAGACERAIALAREASVTGSVNTAQVSELQQLHALAVAPFGIEALAFLGGVPPSTLVSSAIAAILALSLLIVMARRPRTAELPPLAEVAVTMPSLDLPPLPPLAKGPSLDPFVSRKVRAAQAMTAVPPLPAIPPLPDAPPLPMATVAAATSAISDEPPAIAEFPPPVTPSDPPRMAPPPIPAFPSMTAMTAMFPAKD